MSSENVILFYDIPSSVPGRAWSPNTWKTRYSLNYKGLPYQTIWVDLPDLATESKKAGATPAWVDKDGMPVYTLPMIHDPSTGVTVRDSLLIARYLDETYPDTPQLIPHGAQALYHAFVEAFESAISPALELTLLRALAIFSPPAQPRFRWRKEGIMGVRLEELAPTAPAREAAWRRLEDGFGEVDKWIGAGGEGPFARGEMITFADFVIAGWCLWFKLLWGEDSEEWKRIQRWHGGRWDNLLRCLKQFEAVA